MMRTAEKKQAISFTARKPGPVAGPAEGTTGAVETLGPDDFDRDVWCVLGLPIDIADLSGAVAAVEAAVRDRRRLSLVTPNVNWLVRALKDPAARREILNADLSLADGAPLALMARLLGAPQKARVAGSDLFEALRARSGFPGRRIRVFFFGGRDGAAEAASAALAREPGGLESAGWLNPGFGDVASMSAPAIIDAINAARPDFVIAALGAAKGQAWIERNRSVLDAPVVAHLGAVVDFTAGTVARAPGWAKRTGLEWAWRIYAEPSLWRRYGADGAALAGIVLRRLAPQLALGRARPAAEARADLLSAPGGVRIRLGGDLCAGALGPVRRAFRDAARADAVTLDFHDAGGIDRAFLGLVLMLEKHVAARGGELMVDGLGARRRRLFTANALDYPKAEGEPQPAPVRAAG